MAASPVRKLAVIIDDSLTTRKILEVCLRREGIPSLSFADGVEALAALHRQPELAPVVILLDMHLPHQNGLQVALRFRRALALPRSAVIVLTGYDSLPTRMKALLVAGQYIAKPFTTQTIVTAVFRSLSDGQEQMPDPINGFVE